MTEATGTGQPGGPSGVEQPEASGECADQPRGLWFHDRPRGFAQYTGAFIWLAFIAFPAVNAFAQHGTSLDHALTIAGAVAFVGTYVALILLWRERSAGRLLTALFGLLVALATALTLSDGTSWGFLFTYCAAAVGLISTRFGMTAVLGCSALAGLTSALGGANGGQVVGWVASSAGIGLLILVMRDLRIRNEQLGRARAELARMAVAEERERFARDLHDLLGHSLSVIALKAELAGRLLPDRPEQAAGEIAELETVARGALSEVREAVSGYRQPTLDSELAGARIALSAAGIEADVVRQPTVLDPTVEGVLAWAVREGATNVIRHSGARRCQVTISSNLVDAGVEVLDDGTGSPEANGSVGHGLQGLSERARTLEGRLEAGQRPEGGYRLAVTVPLRRP
jgi:two-component system sensor histidine kinase DesK